MNRFLCIFFFLLIISSCEKENFDSINDSGSLQLQTSSIFSSTVTRPSTGEIYDFGHVLAFEDSANAFINFRTIRDDLIEPLREASSNDLGFENDSSYGVPDFSQVLFSRDSNSNFLFIPIVKDSDSQLNYMLTFDCLGNNRAIATLVDVERLDFDDPNHYTFAVQHFDYTIFNTVPDFIQDSLTRGRNLEGRTEDNYISAIKFGDCWHITSYACGTVVSTVIECPDYGPNQSSPPILGGVGGFDGSVFGGGGFGGGGAGGGWSSNSLPAKSPDPDLDYSVWIQEIRTISAEELLNRIRKPSVSEWMSLLNCSGGDMHQFKRNFLSTYATHSLCRNPDFALNGGGVIVLCCPPGGSGCQNPQNTYVHYSVVEGDCE